MQKTLSGLPLIFEWSRSNNIYPIFSTFLPIGRTSAPIESSQIYSLTNIEEQWLSRKLVSIDERFDFKTPNRPYAYFGGETCTQILGIYVDVFGNIWPCPAKTQLANRKTLQIPLGTVETSNGEPSQVWFNHSYMARIRSKYDGSCPYKSGTSMKCKDQSKSLKYKDTSGCSWVLSGRVSNGR